MMNMIERAVNSLGGEASLRAISAKPTGLAMLHRQRNATAARAKAAKNRQEREVAAMAARVLSGIINRLEAAQ